MVKLSQERKLLRYSGVVALIEAVCVLLNAIGVLVAAPGSEGASEGAPIVEAIIFATFAVLIGLVAKSLLAQRRTARPAFFLTQIFTIIIGWTLIAGDGPVVMTIGIAAIALGLIGLALAIGSIIKTDPNEL